mgnify:CR=1 FL=1
MICLYQVMEQFEQIKLDGHDGGWVDIEGYVIGFSYGSSYEKIYIFIYYYTLLYLLVRT